MTTVNAIAIDRCRAAPIGQDTACSNCNLRGLCLPVGLSASDMDRLDALVAMRRTLRRGDSLFLRGDTFASIYAVRSGFFKTTVSTEGGRDQVTGFQSCWVSTASATPRTAATPWLSRTRRSA